MPLLNANTGERVTAVFEIAGPAVVARYKAQLDWFFRDWRQNEIRSMDPESLAILVKVIEAARRQGWDGEVRMHSGYRSRKTNDQLRSRGIGAARNSLHIQAKAIDFSLPGMGMDTLQKLTAAQATGGGRPLPQFRACRQWAAAPLAGLSAKPQGRLGIFGKAPSARFTPSQ